MQLMGPEFNLGSLTHSLNHYKGADEWIGYEVSEMGKGIKGYKNVS